MNPDAVSSLPDNVSTRASIPARIALGEAWQAANGPDLDVARVLRGLKRDLRSAERRYDAQTAHLTPAGPATDYVAEARLLADVATEAPQAAPKPFRYGLTQTRARELTRLRRQSPELARELHVWAVVVTAPQRTQRALAEACAEDSTIGYEAWRKIVSQMVTAGNIRLGSAGFELGATELEPASRPQTSKTARRNLAGKIQHSWKGQRDTTAKAARVRRVMRLGRRKGVLYSSLKSLAVDCSKNGSGSVRAYEYTCKRMYGTEIDWDRNGMWGSEDTLYLVPDYDL